MEAKPFLVALIFTGAGFVSGSVLYCLYLPRIIKGVDVTKVSNDKNPGAYNAFQYAGVPLGILCLILDLAKGYVPVWFSMRFVDPASLLFAAVMLAPVAGHAFSPFKRFHGGKGIAVSFGVLLALVSKRLIVLVLAGMYLLSLLLPLRPNERRTVAAFSAFAVVAMLMDEPFSVKLGCLLIALLVNYKNWRDARIPLPLLSRDRN